MCSSDLDPNSSHPEQATQVFELPRVDQVPPPPLEVPKDSHQDVNKGKEAKTFKGKDKGQDKKKNSSNPIEKALDTTVSQPDQAADPGVPKTKAYAREFFCSIFFFFGYVYCFVVFFFKEVYHLFSLSMKIFFFCLIHHDKCYKINCHDKCYEINCQSRVNRTL